MVGGGEGGGGKGGGGKGGGATAAAAMAAAAREAVAMAAAMAAPGRARWQAGGEGGRWEPSLMWYAAVMAMNEPRTGTLPRMASSMNSPSMISLSSPTCRGKVRKA